MKRIARRMREVVKQAQDEFSQMQRDAEWNAKAARLDSELVKLAAYSGGKQLWTPSWGEQDQEELFRLYGRRPLNRHKPRVRMPFASSSSSEEEEEEEEEEE